MTVDDAKLTRELLAPFREQLVSLHDAEVADQRRARLVASLRTIVRQVPVRRAERRWRTIVGGALPAAAAVALVVGALVSRWSSAPSADMEVVTHPDPHLLRVSASAGEVVHDSGRTTKTIAAGEVASVPARGRISTDSEGGARIESEGLEVTLREKTEVGVEEAEVGLRSLRVARGGVRCVVPSLGRERQFSVVTPDATVVVHGTVFSVRFDEAAKQSCVSVEEGVVSVRHQTGKTWLEAGESWGCEPPEVTTAPSVEPPRVDVRPPRAGNLAAENALFQGALAAERQGDIERAKSRLQALLARYPKSPLAPEARATLARLEAK